jgi:hypothetical protein
MHYCACVRRFPRLWVRQHWPQHRLTCAMLAVLYADEQGRIWGTPGAPARIVSREFGASPAMSYRSARAEVTRRAGRCKTSSLKVRRY